MVKPTHMQRRLTEREQPDFPAIPLWPSSLPCHGFLLFEDGGDVWARLEKYRFNVAGIWSGEYGSAEKVLFVFFNNPQSISPAIFPRALRLKRTGSGRLSSYEADLDHRRSGDKSPPRMIEFFWNGVQHEIKLADLTRQSLARLWPAAELRIHNGSEFAQTDVYLAEVMQNGSAGARRKAANPDAAKIVKRAKIPGTDKGGDVFSDTDRSLQALHENTRLFNILGRLFGGMGKGRRKGGRGKDAAMGEEQEMRDKGPGLFESLAGWARWHMPFSGALAKQLGNRMSLIEKLISRGDIDSALKLALKIGGADKLRGGRNRYSWNLPGMRKNLDFNLNSGSGFSMPILGLRNHFDLWQRYNQLANELEAKGDYRRAAYIWSQLLGNHLQGVLCLEKGGLYKEAAKLALDSHQDPVIAIRLYYKAGMHDTALALARRAACFDRLAEDSRKDNPEFHQYVLKAWTDDLIATHQPVRALEVTESIVAASNAKDADMDLMAARYDWLVMALEMDRENSAEGKISPELAAEAIILAKWDGSDLDPEQVRDFPHAAISQANIWAAAFDGFQSIVSGEDTDDLKRLLFHLYRQASRHRIDQTGFWLGPAKLILDRLTRAVIAQAGDQLHRYEPHLLRRLLQDAPLPVLSVDFGKVKVTGQKDQSRPQKISIPKPDIQRKARILRAAILTGGSTAYWYDTERFELRDRSGKILWSDQISDVLDIIPIGTGPGLMILRRWGDGEVRLSRFEVHRRTFVDIGILHLVAWHDVITDGQWLVQVDNVIGAIDVARLFRSPAELEFLWSTETTNEYRVMAFFQSDKGASWLRMNVSRIRFGVLERTQYFHTGKTETQICLPGPGFNEKFLQPSLAWQWRSFAHGGHGGSFSLPGEYAYNLMIQNEPDAESRRAAVRLAQARLASGFEGFDTIQVCDFGRMLVEFVSDTEFAILDGHVGEQNRITVEIPDGLEINILSRGASTGKPGQNYSRSDRSNILLCTDNAGRIISIDRAARRVDVI